MRINIWDTKPNFVSDEDFEICIRSVKEGNNINAIKQIKLNTQLDLMGAKLLIDKMHDDIKAGAITEKKSIVHLIFKDKTEKYVPGYAEFVAPFIRIGEFNVHSDAIYSYENLSEEAAKLRHLDNLQ
jgi:hypothetical protein